MYVYYYINIYHEMRGEEVYPASYLMKVCQFNLRIRAEHILACLSSVDCN